MGELEDRLLRMEAALWNDSSQQVSELIAPTNHRAVSPNNSHDASKLDSSHPSTIVVSNTREQPVSVSPEPPNMASGPGARTPVPEAGLETNGSLNAPSSMSPQSHRGKFLDGTDPTYAESIVDDESYRIEMSPALQWMMEKTENEASVKEGFTKASLPRPLKVARSENSLSSLMKRPIYTPLPAKEEAIRWVEIFFRAYNAFIPIFDPSSFMALLEKQYMGQPDRRVGWWASLNATIAVGLLLDDQSTHSISAKKQSWGFMSNALAVLNELTMRSPDLLNVQALLTMVFFMQGHGEAQVPLMLVASAARLCHNLRLNLRGVVSHDPGVLRQASRLFWLVCCHDSDNAMVSKIPMAISFADALIDLPAKESEDGLGVVKHPRGKWELNLFRVMVELSNIEAKVYQMLYSPASLQKSDIELITTINTLDQELEAWKICLPLDLQPDYEIQTSDSYLRHHIIVLHCRYHNCLSNIHLVSRRLRSSSHAQCDHSPQIISSWVVYLSAARAMIRLTQVFQPGNPAFIW